MAIARNLKINPNPGRGSVFAPFVRVSIGEKDVFQTGDGYLQRAEVTASEGQNASNCRFQIYDPGRIYAEKYFSHIYEIGGLTPLTPPATASGGSTGAGAGSSTADGTLSPQMRAMLDTIAWAEGADYNVSFGGGTFNGFADHPRRVVRGSGISSSAAGRYQFLSSTWDTLNLPDFTPQSQDRGCVLLIERRGMTANVEAGNIPAALQQLSYEWASLPPYRYPGQGTKTQQQVVDYWNQRLAHYRRGGEATEAATSSIQQPPEEPVAIATSNAGSQITIELGFGGKVIAAYSFLHTSLDCSMFDPDSLVFGGEAAVWVLTQRVQNTAYQNLTFKQFAEKIATSYGMRLEMPIDGPKYDYFPQRGQTDFEALLIEARRLGMRVHCRGNVLAIAPRKADFTGFVLEYADNMGLSFNVHHKAQTDSSGGARSSTPGESASTGQRKVLLDPDTGAQQVVRPENPVGAGSGQNAGTTGSDVAPTAPRTTGQTDTQDATRREGEMRIKGITADFDLPTTPEALLLDPDTPFMTKGVSQFLDRVWVVESITHRYDTSGGLKSSGSCYTPMKSRFPPASAGGAAVVGRIPPLNPGGFARPMAGPVSSGFRTAKRPNHQGVDISAGAGTPIHASADGTVSDAQNGCKLGDRYCGGRYGNRVYIQHAGGYQTRYAHMTQGSVVVTVGQQVRQGQQIGTCNNTGDSRGNHLHFEIRKDGTAVNPASLVDF
jgi:murein DD-endopeptidase MepM/ murein hydrolase activator NlpD/muramidase (phage lysozyme)